MSSEQPTDELSARDREILKDVTLTYIQTGEPVSSRSVAKLRRNQLSAATIRNIMADLEEQGYLAQPHASAGRIPTGAGYHTYIDSLMPARLVPVRARRYIDENLRDSPADGTTPLAVATHLLTELSNQIGIVVTPVLADTVVKALSFVRLSGKRVLCVVVSSGGAVDNKVIETLTPLPRRELNRISNYLTDNFAGMTLRQIRDRLLQLMAEERAQLDQLLAHAITLAQQALGTQEEHELLIEGTSAILMQPELADIERVRKLMDTFTDKARLVRILGQLIDGPGVRVVIGEDSDLTSDLDFSLVATTYGGCDRPLGTLGVFGPSRMEYQIMVPLVQYLGQTLTAALGSRGDRELGELE